MSVKRHNRPAPSVQRLLARLGEGGPDVLPLALGVLALEPVADMRARAVAAVRANADLLPGLLAAAEPEVRALAATAAGYARLPETEAALRALLEDGAPTVRAAAAAALATWFGPTPTAAT